MGIERIVSGGHVNCNTATFSSAMKKAAEDSRTPRRWREVARATQSVRFWSAAVLCRFGSLLGDIGMRKRRHNKLKGFFFHSGEADAALPTH
jgi:hypothetical protein